jgi:hypothetical protein
VCDGGEGPCYERLREVNAQLGRATGSPPSMIPRIRRGQAKYPLSSSCAVCHNEEDSSRRNLKQCARCELTRYCRCVDFVILSCRTKIFGGAALTVKGRTGADTRHAVKWSRRLNGTGISLRNFVNCYATMAQIIYFGAHFLVALLVLDSLM